MYPRKIISKIKLYLNTSDIIVIHGARQTGKSTLLKLLMKDLPETDFYYLDLEDSRFLELCNLGPEDIIVYLRQTGKLKNQKKFYLFIDEIQYIENPSSFLKIMHDHHEYIKLIVSGSSSFEIKSKFKNTLVGRTVDFILYPLDFEEFLIFKNKTINLYEKITSGILIDELINLYKEYVLYGGFPKIVLTDSIEMKEKYIQQIIDTYIKGDIRDLAKIKNIQKFNKLLRVLANQSGNLLNVTEIANTVKIAKQTVDEYLFILENTYIIKLLTPFSKNVRSELFKMPKIYFYDTGILNLLALKQLPAELNGNIFETSIFSEFAKNLDLNNLNFWRTQDKKEIDFIITQKSEIIPVESKLNASSLSLSSLNYFRNAYSTKTQYCISMMQDFKKNDMSLTLIMPWDCYNYFYK